MLEHVSCGRGVFLHRAILGVAPDPGKIKPDSREGSPDIVVDLPGDCCTLLLNGGLKVLGQVCQASLGGGQFGHRLFARYSCLVHLQRPRYDMGQASHVILGKIIRNSQPHGVNCCGLPDGPGEQDKRRMLMQLRNMLPRIKRRKTCQTVVRQNDVERMVCRQGLKGL